MASSTSGPGRGPFQEPLDPFTAQDLKKKQKIIHTDRHAAMEPLSQSPKLNAIREQTLPKTESHTASSSKKVNASRGLKWPSLSSFFKKFSSAKASKTEVSIEKESSTPATPKDVKFKILKKLIAKETYVSGKPKVKMTAKKTIAAGAKLKLKLNKEDIRFLVAKENGAALKQVRNQIGSKIFDSLFDIQYTQDTSKRKSGMTPDVRNQIRENLGLKDTDRITIDKQAEQLEEGDTLSLFIKIQMTHGTASLSEDEIALLSSRAGVDDLKKMSKDDQIKLLGKIPAETSNPIRKQLGLKEIK